MRAVNRDRGTVLATSVERPRSFFGRGIGLLGRKALSPGHALYLSPCRSVHTVGMRFSIDVAFLARDGCVVRVYERLRPFRVTVPVLAAAGALELPPGVLSLTRTRVGDRIVLAR